MSTDENFSLSIDGFCPICERPARFSANHSWLRGSLFCQSCPNGSVPRERALALILNELRPAWRSARIHESSPGNRGISVKLKECCANYVGSHFFPDSPFGSLVKGWRNENIESQTFADKSFDIVITQDVLEHVFHPAKVFAEVHRTLDDDGLFLSTFPIQRSLINAVTLRAEITEGGTITHHMPPEFHGNPISGDGSLVTVDYGYDIHETIALWADFDVRIYRFSDKKHGILGRYTEVIACQKRRYP